MVNLIFQKLLYFKVFEATVCWATKTLFSYKQDVLIKENHE